MSRRPPLLVAASLVAVALALAGCSGASDTTAEKTPVSPLGEYMNAIYGMGDDDEWQKQAIEKSKKTEELIAVCMSKEGFEYVPNPQTAESFSMSGGEWKPDDREWVSQYGYGAVNQPGMDDPAPEQTGSADPNSEYVESLSESERDAFYATLYGPQPTEEEAASGEWSPTWEEQGCYGAADHEISGEDPTTSDEHKPLMDAMQKMYEESSTAPELAELNAAWSDCMSSAGHGGFAAQADAQNSVWDEMNKYYESQTEYVEDDPKLEEMGEKEIELALADLDCREETDYTAKAQKIQWAIEDRFIADHKSELDALKADAEKARS